MSNELNNEQPYGDDGGVQPSDSYSASDPKYPTDETDEESHKGAGENNSNRSLLLGVLALVVLLIAGFIFYMQFEGKGNDSDNGEQTTAVQSDEQGQGDTDAANNDPYVDDKGAQEHEAEPAPGSFDGIESMAMDFGGDVAPVDPVQLTDTGMLIPPLDVHRLGWYSASATPGDAGPVGSSVITGHINYQDQGEGYAAHFVDLKEGDEFTVQVDGEPRTFRVTESSYRLPKGSNFPDVVNDTEGENRLVLITCGGEFVGGQLGYADNIITVAEPVEA